MSDVFESFADLDALAEELRSEDPKRRRVAVIELEDSGELAAVPLLASLSEDPDAGVRRQVAIALGSFDGPETAAALIRALVDADGDVAAAAAASLAELKESDAAGPLLAFVGHPSAFVRESIYRALKGLRSRDSLEPALKAFRDPEPAVRVQAISVIGYLKLEETLPALKHAALDGDANVRLVAVNALVFSRSQAAANAIAAALNDEDWRVREAGATALALSPSGATHSDQLIKALDDAFWQVRLSAIRSLGKLEIHRSASRIVQELNHVQPNVRKEAAAALGTIRSPESREALLAVAEDPDADVRKNVRWALQELEHAQRKC